mgnify:CR=1 FL=1
MNMCSALLSCLIGVYTVSVAGAGDLDPPPGPVAPSMKTLDQVEPRTAVNEENTPGTGSASFVIDEPGSYYLTSNITGEAGKSGISIRASGVTLDLNGFTVEGVDGATNGINVGELTFRQGVRITNGVVRDWPGVGVRLRAEACQVDRVRLVDNETWGLDASEGFELTLESCSGFINGTVDASEKGDFRLAQASVVRDCISRSTDGVAFSASEAVSATLRGCTAQSPRDGGFYLESRNVVLSDCAASNAAGESTFVDAFEIVGSSIAIENCAARQASGTGFVLRGPVDTNDGTATIRGCAAQNCGLDGFEFRRLSVTAENCIANGSDSDGFALDSFEGGLRPTSVFRGCVARDSGADGFDLDEFANAIDCSAAGAGDNGFVSRDSVTFENCTAMEFTRSGFVVGQSCVARDCNAVAGCDTTAAIEVDGLDAHVKNNTISNDCTPAASVGVLVSAADAVIEGNTIDGMSWGVELTSSSSDAHVWRNFFNDGGDVLDNGVINTVAPILSDSDIANATNPFANWGD